MSQVKRWLAFLDERKVRYSHSVHPWARTALATARAENIPARDLAKTVVYFSNHGFGIAVVPADQLVDLARIANRRKLSEIRLADPDELDLLFPACEIGAMPPFGGSCEMPVMVDGELATDFIAFAIGTHRDVVRMRFTDFQRLTSPVIASIAMPMEESVLC